MPLAAIFKARHNERYVLETISAGAFVMSEKYEETIRQLISSGHVVWDSTGSLALTKAGEHRVFHIQCRVAFASLIAGEAQSVGENATNWLIRSGFVRKDNLSGELVPTLRGTDWLASS
jgi:hypothetical protein